MNRARSSATDTKSIDSSLEDALNLSSDGIIIYEAVRDDAGAIVDYTVIALNDAAREIFSMQRDIIVGDLITELWPTVKEHYVWEEGGRVVSTRETYHAEIDRPKPEGGVRWFEITMRPYRDGFACSYRDITAAKEALYQTEKQKQFYEDLLRQSVSRKAVCRPIYNVDGRIENFRYEYANYGKDIDDSHRHLPMFNLVVKGSLLTDVLPSVKSTEIWDFYCAIAESGQSGRIEYHYVLDGIDAVLDIAGKRLEDGSILIAYSDVSPSHELAVALNKEKSQLDGVFQNVPLGLTVFEAVRADNGDVVDLRLVKRNERALALSRISPEKYVPGALISDIMPNELSQNLELLFNVVRTGEPTIHELYQPHMNGWILSRIVKHGDGIISSIQDVTEQKRISEEIEDGARLLNAVLDASPIALVVYSAIRDEHNVIQDFQPIVVNRQALEISGYTSERFLNETFFERSPTSRERLEALARVVQEQIQERFEHQVYSSGKWVDSIATPFGDGFIATSKDITALKEQTRIIEEQAVLFEGVLSSLQNGLTILGVIRNDEGELEDLKYLQIADITAEEMRMPREAIIGNTMRSIYPGIDQTNYWSAYQAVVRTGAPQHFETHFTMQGYDNYLLNWVTPLGSDKLVSVYYIVNDLKRTQKELEHTVHELKRSNDDLEQFASVASHDLQEPLRKLQSFGSMLEQRYADRLDEYGVNLLQRMQGAAGRMRDLVSGLLSFARLSGYSDGELVAVDLSLLLHSITADLDEALAAAKGMISISGTMPHVSGIEGQLRHLFHNLLTNAIKFRKAGVSPRIEVVAGPLRPGDKEMLSPMANSDEYVRIEIRDNGIGFEPEYAEKIFGLFERLHGNSEYQGTGIGLSICRRVAERHEGAIAAESVPGVGSTFIVLLRKA